MSQASVLKAFAWLYFFLPPPVAIAPVPGTPAIGALQLPSP
jgi:hypothetical protein